MTWRSCDPFDATDDADLASLRAERARLSATLRRAPGLNTVRARQRQARLRQITTQILDTERRMREAGHGA